jgi:hypothetical protein
VATALVQWVLKTLKLYKIHDALSKVTEKRKACMPWEGTLDFWVLLAITVTNLTAVFFGATKLQNKDAIFTLKGCESQNIQMIALVFAFIEATPGLLFMTCAHVSSYSLNGVHAFKTRQMRHPMIKLPSHTASVSTMNILYHPGLSAILFACHETMSCSVQHVQLRVQCSSQLLYTQPRASPLM